MVKLYGLLICTKKTQNFLVLDKFFGKKYKLIEFRINSMIA